MTAVVRRGAVEHICRLTPLQDGMFFEALRKQGSGEVIYQACLEFAGPVRPALLREAWRMAVRRHAILRTSFHYEGLDAPVQVAHRSAEPPWREVDLRGLDPAAAERAIAEFVAVDRREPFDLARAPLMRLACLRVTGDRTVLVWTYHHLLLDGWSMYLVLDDVTTCYRALGAGRRPALAPTRPYWEYVAWLREKKTGAEETFWRDRLGGITAPTQLGHEEVAADQAEDFGQAARTVPRDVVGRLEELARSRRVTLATVVQGAWAVVLARYTGDDEVVFGSVVSGRTPEFAGMDDMVGLYINVLPVVAAVAADRSASDWLAGLQSELLEARQFEHTALSDLRRWSGVPRGVPLFESIAVFINYPVREGWTDGGDTVVTGQRVLQQPHYPLHLTVVGGGAEWWMSLGYDNRRFRRGTAERLADLVCAVLRVVAAQPDTPVADLPAWSAGTTLRRLVADGEPPVHLGFADLVRGVATRRPDAPAVMTGGQVVTYRQLVSAAEEIAGPLRGDGARPVRLDAERPVELPVPLLAAAFAGLAVTFGDAPTVSAGDELALPALVTDTTLVPRDTLAQMLCWLQRTMPLAEDDRLCRTGSPDLATVRDVWWAMAAGVAVVDEDAAPTVLCGSVESVTAVLRAGGQRPRRITVSPGPLPSRVLADLPRGVAVIEEHPCHDAAASSVFVFRGGDQPLISPGLGRQLRTGRGYPVRHMGRPVPDDPRLWAVTSVIARHPSVVDATAHVLPADGDGGASSVVVHVVPADGHAVPAVDLVRSRLSPDLVPARVVITEALPYTVDGQVDVAALLADGGSDARDATGDHVAAQVRAVWAGVFDTDPGGLGDDTDFFELGGHSLLAIKLVSRLRATFATEITLNDLFATPTVGGCVRTVRRALTRGGEPELDAPIPRRPAGPTAPMSYAQERLWFLDQLDAGPANNVMLPTRIARALDPDLVEEALRQVIQRHEVLRTRLRADGGTPVQVVLPEADPVFEFDDLGALPLDLAERRARSALEADVVRRFDLATEPPLRARLIRLGADDHVLGVCVHHVAFDGWSTSVLLGDLDTVYTALSEGRADPLLPLPVQYADFAVWQRERLSGERLERLLAYWRERLEGAPEVLSLAPPLPAPHTGGAEAEHVVFLPPALRAAVDAMAAKEGSTEYMALLTAYAVLLARTSEQDDIVVGVPVAGREHPDVAGLVGFFVNTTLVRVEVGAASTFRDLLQTVRRDCVGALVNSELPFDQLVRALRPDRAADRLPLVQAAFTFQNVPSPTRTFAGAPATFFPVNQVVARFELELDAYHWDGGIRCVFRYAADRYTPALVARLGREFADLVRRFADSPDAELAAPTATGGAPDGRLAERSRELLRAALATGTEEPA